MACTKKASSIHAAGLFALAGAPAHTALIYSLIFRIYIIGLLWPIPLS